MADWIKRCAPPSGYALGHLGSIADDSFSYFSSLFGRDLSKVCRRLSPSAGPISS